jgi:hypothetical protein
MKYYCGIGSRKTVGGTATAIKLARALKIPVYNLANSKDINKFIGEIINKG